MICQLYPSFVSNFKSKTQKMAQEPYFENSDQSCKSNNTLKNCTNIFETIYCQTGYACYSFQVTFLLFWKVSQWPTMP